MNEQEIREFQKYFTGHDRISDRDAVMSATELLNEYNYALANGSLSSQILSVYSKDKKASDFANILGMEMTRKHPDLYTFRVKCADMANPENSAVIKKYMRFLLYANLLILEGFESILKSGELYSIIREVLVNLKVNASLLIITGTRIQEMNLDSQMKDILLKGRNLELESEQGKAEDDKSLNTFADFITQMKQEAGIDENLSQGEAREEFIEKLYIWEMKNFNVDRLKNIINEADLKKVKTEFDAYTQNIKELMNLHKEYGLLNTMNFKKEAQEIEDLLFDPDSIARIRKKIDTLKDKIKYVQTFKRSVRLQMYFESFISDSTNRSAYNKIGEIINRENTDNLIVVTGPTGAGKTHLLNSVLNNMPGSKIILLDESNIETAKNENYINKYINDIDVLLIDNLDNLFSDEANRPLLKGLVLNNKSKVITMHRKYSLEDRQILDHLNKYPTLNMQPTSLFIKKTVMKNMLQKYGIEINEIMLNYMIDYVSVPLSVLETYMKQLSEAVGTGIPTMNNIHTIFPKKEEKKAVSHRKSQFDTSKLIKEWRSNQDRLYVEFEG